jgi:hypothetical protein
MKSFLGSQCQYNTSPTDSLPMSSYLFNEVLSGRGGATNSHSGNRAFRMIVKEYRGKSTVRK